MMNSQQQKDDILRKMRNKLLMDRYDDMKNGFISTGEMKKQGKSILNNLPSAYKLASSMYNGYKNMSQPGVISSQQPFGTNLMNGGKEFLKGAMGVAKGNYPNYGSTATVANNISTQAPTTLPNTNTIGTNSISNIPSTGTPSSIPTSMPMNTIGDSAVGNAINANVMGNASNAGTSAVGNAIGQQVGSSATQGASSAAGGASQALGAAGSALSVGMDAKNMVDNGVNLRNGSDMLADIGSGIALATGVGAPVALAIQAGKFIKNLIMGAIEKKKRKAMARSEKAAAEAAANNEASMDEDRQKMEQQRQQNLQSMQQSQQALTQTSDQAQSPVAEAIQQQTQPQDIKQDIMNRFVEQQIPQPQQEEQQGGNDMLNALGTVASALPTGNTQTPNPQTPTPQPPTPTPQTPTPTPQPQVPQQEQSVTGGAAPVINYKTENQPLSYEGSAQQEIDKNAVMKQSLMDRIRNGFNDFSEGYQDNANSSLSTGDLAKRFQQPTQPQKTEDGAYIASADQNKKSIMARLGEMAGTGQRIASHPLTQAAIAGGISKLAGGDIDDIAKAAWQYGSQKAEADRYYQDVTGKTNRPFINTYGIDDYKTKVQQDMYNQKLKQTQDQFDTKLDWEKQKDEANRQNKIEVANIRADALKNRANGRGSGNAVAQQKYDYQKEFNNNIGYVYQAKQELDKAQEAVDKAGWFANSKQKAALEAAKQKFAKSEQGMLENYGNDYLKFKKQQGW